MDPMIQMAASDQNTRRTRRSSLTWSTSSTSETFRGFGYWIFEKWSASHS